MILKEQKKKKNSLNITNINTYKIHIKAKHKY